MNFLDNCRCRCHESRPEIDYCMHCAVLHKTAEKEKSPVIQISFLSQKIEFPISDEADWKLVDLILTSMKNTWKKKTVEGKGSSKASLLEGTRK